MKLVKMLLAVSFIGIINFSSIGEIKAEAMFYGGQQENIATLEEEIGAEVDMTVMTNEELSYVNDKVNEIEDVTNLKNEISNDGFEELNVAKDKTSYKYSIEGSEGTAVYMTSEVYESDDEMIVTFTQYDEYNDNVSLYYAEKRSTVDVNQEPESMLEYSNAGENNNDGISTYASFNWNGQSFACSATGLFACAQFCGVWALVNPIAGGTCGAVCGLAFAAACATA